MRNDFILKGHREIASPQTLTLHLNPFFKTAWTKSKVPLRFCVGEILVLIQSQHLFGFDGQTDAQTFGELQCADDGHVGQVKFPDVFAEGCGHCINDLVVGERVFACDVVTFADGHVRLQGAENGLGNIVHEDGLLQGLTVPKDRHDGRNPQETDEPPHVAVSRAAVDHGWAQDGKVQSARMDGFLCGEADGFAACVQLREDGSGADEDRAFDARCFCGADYFICVAEAERGDVDEGICALHGGGQ